MQGQGPLERVADPLFEAENLKLGLKQLVSEVRECFRD